MWLPEGFTCQLNHYRLIIAGKFAAGEFVGRLKSPLNHVMQGVRGETCQSCHRASLCEFAHGLVGGVVPAVYSRPLQHFSSAGPALLGRSGYTTSSYARLASVT